MASYFPMAIIATPFLFAGVLSFTGSRIGAWAGRLALIPPLVATVLGIILWQRLDDTSAMTFPLPLVPALDMNANLRIDRLGCFFVILVGGIGLAVVQYSRAYFSETPPRAYWPFLLFFMGAMLGLVLSDSLILLYIFWELTTIASALLIGIRTEDESARRGAIQAFLVTGMGGLALLAGILLLGTIGGSYDISDLSQRADLIMDNPLHHATLVLIAIGAFAKSAQWPLHFWLPGAMAAPAPISAYLHSATMVNAGVFLLSRFVPILGSSDLWQPLLLSVGIATFFMGSWAAFRATDLKQLLAYSTVSYLGVLTSLYAYVPETGSKGELLHFANHALYKSSLFLLLGWFEKIAGTRDIAVLEEQFWLPRQPIGGILFAIGALAMAGGPFLLGFESKKLYFEDVVGRSSDPVVAIAVFCASVLTVAAALKLTVGPFWGSKVPPPPPKHVSIWLIVIPALLLLPQVIGGIVPGWFLGTVLEPASEWPGGVSFWRQVDLGTISKILIFAVGALLFLGWRIESHLPTLPKAENLASATASHALRLSAAFGDFVQAGGTPRYLSATFLTATILALAILIGNPIGFPLSIASMNIDARMAGVPALLVAVGAFLALTLLERVAKLVAMAMAGYGLTLFYVVYRAPDLALTQVLVETVSLILLLLAFRRLPVLSHDERPIGQRLAHTVIAVGLGTAATVATLAAARILPPETSGDMHLAASLPDAGGRNVVNVILTDFRGADTLVEIAVLAVAALGVTSALRARKQA